MAKTNRILVALLAFAVVIGTPFWVRSRLDDSAVEERQRELEQISQKCEDMQQRNEELRRRIRALDEDPRYLEKAVRSELGWVRDGERVYAFERAGQAKATPIGRGQ